MWQVIARPLDATSRTRRRWVDGRRTADVVEEFIKPNDRLTALERLEIYNRCYWFRLLDCMYDDCPGLRAVLGEKRFMRLAEAYLTRYPSRSFTLRNLCRRLPRFIREQPALTAPQTRLAWDLARFEWAQIVAFDGESRPVVTTDNLLDADPARLRLGLQPYVTLLALDYPLDDFLVAVKRSALRGADSHTPDGAPSAARAKKKPRPKRLRTHLAVHRYQNRIFYKRLEPAAFRVLTAIQAGRTLRRALAVGLPRAARPREDWAAKVQGWFSTWMELGWFCRR